MVGRKWPDCIQSMAQAVTHDREAHGAAGAGQMGRIAVGVGWEAKVEQGAKEHQVLALGPHEHGWGCGCDPSVRATRRGSVTGTVMVAVLSRNTR